MINRGTKIKVQLRDKRVIYGWLFDFSRMGVYIALDASAEKIQFFPRGMFRAVTPEETNEPTRSMLPPSNIRDKGFLTNKQEAELTQELLGALDNIDYNYVRRLRNRFEKIKQQFTGLFDRLTLVQRELERDNIELINIAVELRATYLEFIGELNRSGLGDILLRRAEHIRRFIANDGLPLVDYWVTHGIETFEDTTVMIDDMADLAVRTNLIIENELGAGILQNLNVSKIVQQFDETEIEPNSREDRNPWPNRLKKISALGKIAAGGSLSAVNVCAGAFVGIVTALPTMGLGTIAGAIGIATSTYTGINAACDGIKDFANTMEAD